MRPHSVSVWPSAAPVLSAPEAAELGEAAGGASEAVLPDGAPDPHAARTKVAMAAGQNETLHAANRRAVRP